MLDLLKPLKTIERDVRIIKRSLNVHDGLQETSWPFSVPLKSQEDIDNCEEFLATPDNYQNFKLFLIKKLSHTSPVEQFLKLVKTLFEDEVFFLVGHSKESNEAYQRKDATKLVVFSTLFQGKSCFYNWSIFRTYTPRDVKMCI